MKRQPSHHSPAGTWGELWGVEVLGGGGEGVGAQYGVSRDLHMKSGH